MLSKTELLSILVGMEARGIDINPYMKKVIVSSEIPMEVLKFVAKNNGIEVSNFYEYLRKRHNQNKSPLYTNILKETKTEEDIITTLSCLLVQIVLYGNKLESKDKFLQEARAAEITKALNSYFENNDLATSSAVLNLIKADLMVLECLNDRRELTK